MFRLDLDKFADKLDPDKFGEEKSLRSKE